MSQGEHAPPSRGPGLFPYLLLAVLTFLALMAIGVGRSTDGLSGLLTGPDDVMRMVQVVDWLDGQGWTDTVQRRLDPPEGVRMHWSRLADVPPAVVILAAEPIFGRDTAILISAVTVPVLLGTLFTTLFLWATLPLTTRRRAVVPILMVGALVLPLQQLLPGRIDHHGLQLVLTVFALGCLVRALGGDGTRWALGLGVAGGFSLAIGLEALPLLGAVTVILSLTWVLRGDAGAPALFGFGAALVATVLILIATTLPAGQWASPACDRMSVVHLALTAIVLAAGTGAVALSPWQWGGGWVARLGLAAAIGGGGLAVVVFAFPHCAGSPYAALPAEARYWLEAVNEARSIFEFFQRKPGPAVAFVILPLAALVSVAWQWMRSHDRTDPTWLGLTVLVAIGLAFATWQIRGAAFANVTAAFALIPLAAAVNARADRAKGMLARVGLRVTLPLACVFAVLLPNILLEPPEPKARAERKAACDIDAIAGTLNDPAGLGARTLTIAAPVDVGPSILLLTPHKVLAAPYHRGIRGLADNRRVFAGHAGEALAIIGARGIDAVVFCDKHAHLSAYRGRPGFLIARLAEDRPPPWLKTVRREKGIGLYLVRAIPGPGR